MPIRLLRWWILLSALVGGVALTPTDGGARRHRPPSSAPRRPKLEVPLRVMVAWCPGPARDLRPVRPPRWVAEHLREAQEVLTPHGVILRPRVERFTPRRCELVTRRHRHEMARHVTRRHEPTVLVVRRVQDLAVPTYNLMGVHWRYRGRLPEHQGTRWIFLTARARPPVLAHELCHFFGLPHDRRGGSLMTPGPSDPIWKKPGAKPRPWRHLLRPAQARRLRQGIRAFFQPRLDTPTSRPAVLPRQRSEKAPPGHLGKTGGGVTP